MQLEIAGLNATELGGYCRRRVLFSEQVAHWRQAGQGANAQAPLTSTDHKDLQKRQQEEQRESKRLQQELRRKVKALAAAMLLPQAAAQQYGLKTVPGLLGRG
ncbi:MAG: hypothetical protein ACOVNL_11040 [Prochlorococcaceae cyanobacterium]